MTNFVEQYSGSFWNYSLLAINVLVTSTQLPTHVEDLFVSGYIYALVAYILSFYVIRRNIDTLQKLPEAKTLLKKELWYWNLVAFILDIAFLIGLFVSFGSRSKEEEDIYRMESPMFGFLQSPPAGARGEQAGARSEQAGGGDEKAGDEKAEAGDEKAGDEAKQGNYDVFYVTSAGLLPAGVTGVKYYYTYKDDPRAAASEEKYSAPQEKKALDNYAGFTFFEESAPPGYVVGIGTPVANYFPYHTSVLPRRPKNLKETAMRILGMQGIQQARAKNTTMGVEEALQMFKKDKAKKQAETEAWLKQQAKAKSEAQYRANQEMRFKQFIRNYPSDRKFTEEDLVKAWNTIPSENVAPEEVQYLVSASNEFPKWGKYVADKAYLIKNPLNMDDDRPGFKVYSDSARNPTLNELELFQKQSQYPLAGLVQTTPAVRLSNRDLRMYGLPPPNYSASYALPTGPMTPGITTYRGPVCPIL